MTRPLPISPMIIAALLCFGASLWKIFHSPWLASPDDYQHLSHALRAWDQPQYAFGIWQRPFLTWFLMLLSPLGLMACRIAMSLFWCAGAWLGSSLVAKEYRVATFLFLYMIPEGFLQSFNLLAEPLAMTLIVCWLWSLKHNRSWLAGLTLGLAIQARSELALLLPFQCLQGRHRVLQLAISSIILLASNAARIYFSSESWQGLCYPFDTFLFPGQSHYALWDVAVQPSPITHYLVTLPQIYGPFFMMVLFSACQIRLFKDHLFSLSAFALLFSAHSYLAFKGDASIGFLRHLIPLIPFLLPLIQEGLRWSQGLIVCGLLALCTYGAWGLNPQMASQGMVFGLLAALGVTLVFRLLRGLTNSQRVLGLALWHALFSLAYVKPIDHSNRPHWHAREQAIETARQQFSGQHLQVINLRSLRYAIAELPTENLQFLSADNSPKPGVILMSAEQAKLLKDPIASKVTAGILVPAPLNDQSLKDYRAWIVLKTFSFQD